jgi:peroxiredoxin
MKTFASLLLATLFAASAFGQGLINRRAPSFSLPDSAFNQFDILDYRGKWLLLEFMMTTPQNCVKCRDVTKRLDALMVKNGTKLSVLAIANTPPETQDTVKAYINETKTKIPVLFDASMVAMAYFKATPSRPAIDPGHVFAINPQGTIVQDWTAALASDAMFTADVEKLLNGGGTAAPKAEPAVKSKSKK